MHDSTYANIRIYKRVINTYTNIPTFKNIQTKTHIHTNNPTFRTKKFTLLIVFYKSSL